MGVVVKADHLLPAVYDAVPDFSAFEAGASLQVLVAHLANIAALQIWNLKMKGSQEFQILPGGNILQMLF